MDTNDETLDGFRYLGSLEIKSNQRLQTFIETQGMNAGHFGLRLYMCEACGCVVADQEQHARFSGRAARCDRSG